MSPSDELGRNPLSAILNPQVPDPQDPKDKHPLADIIAGRAQPPVATEASQLVEAAPADVVAVRPAPAEETSRFDRFRGTGIGRFLFGGPKPGDLEAQGFTERLATELLPQPLEQPFLRGRRRREAEEAEFETLEARGEGVVVPTGLVSEAEIVGLLPEGLEREAVSIAERMNRRAVGIDVELPVDLDRTLREEVWRSHYQELANRGEEQRQREDEIRFGRLRAVQKAIDKMSADQPGLVSEAFRRVATSARVEFQRQELPGSLAELERQLDESVLAIETVSSAMARMPFDIVSDPKGELGTDTRPTTGELTERQRSYAAVLRHMTPGQRASMSTSAALPFGDLMSQYAELLPDADEDPAAFQDAVRQVKETNEDMMVALGAIAQEDSGTRLENYLEDVATYRLPIVDDTIPGFAGFILSLQWLRSGFSRLAGRGRKIAQANLALSASERVAMRRAGLSAADVTRIERLGIRNPAQGSALAQAGFAPERLRELAIRGGTSTSSTFAEKLIVEAVDLAAVGAINAAEEGGGIAGVSAAIAGTPAMIAGFRVAGLPLKVIPPVIRGARRFNTALGRETALAWAEFTNNADSRVSRQWNAIMDRIATDYVETESFNEATGALESGRTRARQRLEIETRWNPMTGKVERGVTRRLRQVRAGEDDVSVVATNPGDRTQVSVSFQRTGIALFADENGNIERREVALDMRPDLRDKIRATRQVAEDLGIPVTGVMEATGIWEGATEPSFVLVIPRRLTLEENVALAERFQDRSFANQETVLTFEADPRGRDIKTTLHVPGGIDPKMRAELITMLAEHGFKGASFFANRLEVIQSEGLSGTPLGELTNAWMDFQGAVKKKFGLKEKDFVAETGSGEMAGEFEDHQLTTVMRDADVRTYKPGEKPSGAVIGVEVLFEHGYDNPALRGSVDREIVTGRVNASAKEPGKWQLTFFDGEGDPMADKQFSTLSEALTDAREGGGSTIRRGRFQRVGGRQKALREMSDEELFTAIEEESARALEAVRERDRAGPAERAELSDRAQSRLDNVHILEAEQLFREREFKSPANETIEGAEVIKVLESPEVTPELLEAGRTATHENPRVRHLLDTDARGVVVGAQSALDRVFSESEARPRGFTAQSVYDSFAGIRETLRERYGDTVRLWRAEARADDQIPNKHTLNYAESEARAQEFAGPGREVRSVDVPVADIVALSVPGPKGRYYEFIALNPKATEGRVRLRHEGEAPTVQRADPVIVSRQFIERATVEESTLVEVENISEAGKVAGGGTRAPEGVAWIAPEGRILARTRLTDHGIEAARMLGVPFEDAKRELYIRQVTAEGGMVRHARSGQAEVFNFGEHPDAAQIEVIIELAMRDTEGGRKIVTLGHMVEAGKGRASEIPVTIGVGGNPPMNRVTPQNIRRAFRDMAKPIDERVHVGYLANENMLAITRMLNNGEIDRPTFDAYEKAIVEAYNGKGPDPTLPLVSAGGVVLGLWMANEMEDGVFGEEYKSWGSTLRLAAYAMGAMGVGRVTWEFARRGGTPEAARAALRSLFEPSDAVNTLRLAPSMRGRVDAAAERLPAVEELLRIAERGKAHRKWYRKANVEIRRVFGEDANLFSALLAITSPRRNVRTNMITALQAYEVMRGGRILGRGAQLNALERTLPFTHRTLLEHVLDGRYDDLGGAATKAERAGTVDRVRAKINAFYNNLSGNSEPVTVDVWMARIFGLLTQKKDRKGRLVWEQQVNDTNTAFVTEVVQSIAQRLGWGNDEVQAAMWATVKWMTEAEGWQPKTRKGGADARLIAENVRSLIDFVDNSKGTPKAPEFSALLRELGVSSRTEARRFGADESTAAQLRGAVRDLEPGGGKRPLVDQFVDRMQFMFSTGLLQNARERSVAMERLLGEYRAQRSLFPGDETRIGVVEQVEARINEVGAKGERMWRRRVPFRSLLPTGLLLLPLLQDEEDDITDAGISWPMGVVLGVTALLGAREAARGLRRLRLREADPLARRYDLIADLTAAMGTSKREALKFEATRRRLTPRSPAERRRVARDVSVALRQAADQFFELVYDGKESEIPQSIINVAADRLGARDKVGGQEGLRQLVERFVTAPEELRRQNARGMAAFIQRLGNRYPHMLEAMEKAAIDHRLIREDPELAAMMERFQHKHRNRWDVRGLWDRVQADWVNTFEPMAQMMRDLTGESRPSLELYAEFWARLSKGAAGVASAMMNRGVLDYTSGKIRKDIRPMAEIVREIGTTRVDQFEWYVTAQRVLELYRLREEREQPTTRTVEGPGGDPIEQEIKLADMTEAEARSVFNKLDNGDFRRIFGDLRQYQQGLLEYLRDAGVITEAGFDAMVRDQPNYVPLFRYIEDGGLGGPRVRAGFDHVFAPIKKLKGESDRTLLGVYAGISMNTQAFAEVVARHEVNKSIARLAELDTEGVWIRPYTPPARPVSFEGKEIAGQLRELGVPEQYHSLFRDEALTIWRPDKAFGREGIISILNPDGTRKFFELVGDNGQQVARTLQRLGPGSRTFFGEIVGPILRGATALKRATATTFSPTFLARNPARDVLQAFITSEFGFNPATDFARGVFHLFKKDDMYWQWLASGGARATMMEVDRSNLRESVLSELTNDPRFRESRQLGVSIKRKDKAPIFLSLNPLHWMRIASDAMENSTRMGAFTRALVRRGPRNVAERGTVPENVTREMIVRAAEESREISIDFQRVGMKGEAMRQMVAFWNPAVQGYSKFFRSHKQNPKKTIMRAVGAITVPSVLNWIINHDDEEWRRRPRWERTLFWLWKMPNGRFLRFPKPFEFGIVYGSMVESMLDWMSNEDPKGMRNTVDTLVNQFTGTLMGFNVDITGDRERDIGGIGPSGMMPDFARPLIEASMNYDFFREHEIVSGRAAKRSTKFQYHSVYTSQWARDMGQLLGMSPSKVEHIFFGYTTAAGRLVGLGADSFINMMDPPETGRLPTDFPFDLPLISGFVGRQTNLNAPAVTDFYGLLDNARRAAEDVRALEDEGLYDDAAEREAEMSVELDMLRDLNRAGQEINQLRRDIDDIRFDPKLSGAEKTEQMQPLILEIVQIAEDMVLMAAEDRERSAKPLERETGTEAAPENEPAGNPLESILSGG